MPNRLAGETSPYLLQHQDNPVDWFPWGEEAFKKAKREGKPVFLSVGYSSCHWCHVMAHESFEDAEIGAALNQDFIAVKVDREERPDVDEAYMAAVQLASGRGGWPMSVFLTPDKKPFLAGTYYPKQERGGMPGFASLLRQVAEAWKTRKPELESSAEEFSQAIRETLAAGMPETTGQASEALLHQAVKLAASEFDVEHGGSVGAPKFPPHSQIEFLIAYALWEGAEPELRDAAVGIALRTLQGLCLGGIHDHVGGGFHRYSTDEKWLLPHFEKMLYDNALMLGNLAQGAAIAGQIDPGLQTLFIQGVGGIVAWLDSAMTSPDGLFYSALDADSEGEEGKFYVWTQAEVESLLGPEAKPFLEAFHFQQEGNFEDEATRKRTGVNIPHLKEAVGDRFDAELEKLRIAREGRVHPALDEKALVGWNGLMIRALAQIGALEAAEKCAEAILQAEAKHGELPHQIVRGVPSGKAFLEDYACLAQGLASLAVLRELMEESEEGQSEGVAVWRGHAARLTATMVERFWDGEKGGFFATGEGHEELFGRSKPAFDTPIPSANAIAARCQLQLGETDRATKTLDAMRGWMERAPGVTEALHLALLESLEGEPQEAQPRSETPAELAMPPIVPKASLAVSLQSSEIVAGQDGDGRGVVVIAIPDGLHINSSEPPARWLTPTSIEVQPLEAKVLYPMASNDRYEGRIEIPFTVKLPSGESGADLEITVSYQACTESECLLPETKSLGAVLIRG